MSLNWWEVLCLVIASIASMGILGYIAVRVLVGWGMNLQPRDKS